MSRVGFGRHLLMRGCVRKIKRKHPATEIFIESAADGVRERRMGGAALILVVSTSVGSRFKPPLISRSLFSNVSRVLKSVLELGI